MELFEYIWKSKLSANKLARQLDCNANTLGNIKCGRSSAGLLMALKLEKLSEGQITLADLLSPEDKEKYEKWLASYSPERYK